jgi:hypothetical protein
MREDPTFKLGTALVRGLRELLARGQPFVRGMLRKYCPCKPVHSAGSCHCSPDDQCPEFCV